MGCRRPCLYNFLQPVVDVVGKAVAKAAGKCFMVLKKDGRRSYQTNDLVMSGGEATVHGVGRGGISNDLSRDLTLFWRLYTN